MKRILFLFIFIKLFEHGNIHAQITFNKTYHDNVDGIFTILVDGSGYKQVMHSMDSPYRSFIFQDLDSNGIILSSKKYGDAPETYLIYSLCRTIDTCFAIGASCYNIQSNKGLSFLAKLNQIGDTLWTRKYSAPQGFDFYGQYMIETSDHGFLITGQIADSLITDADIFILKTDSLGNFEWMNSFGGIRFDCGYSSVQTPDGGYLTAGWTRSFGFGNNSNRDDIVVKWDSVGNYQWHKTYGTGDYETAIGITKIADGNYIVSSGSYSYSLGVVRGKIIKIDQNGNIIWKKHQGVDVNAYYWVREMSSTDLVGITSIRVNNIDDGFIIRTDSSGTEKWRRQYRYGNSHCYFRDVQETPDGGIICAGFVFDGASGGQDGWLVKLDSTGCLSSGCGEPTGLFETASSSPFTISVSPNPISTQAIIKVDGLSQRLLNEPYQLRVYDLQGKLVQQPETGFLVSDTWIQCIFKPEGLHAGIYLIEVVTYGGERLGVVKVVVQ